MPSCKMTITSFRMDINQPKQHKFFRISAEQLNFPYLLIFFSKILNIKSQMDNRYLCVNNIEFNRFIIGNVVSPGKVTS